MKILEFVNLTRKLSLAGCISICFSSIILFPTLLKAQAAIDDILELSLTDLLSVEITSVSKKAQPLSQVASAIYVITQKDIISSGVTSIPEALRMAPGIQVARIDANRWSISSRGFSQQFSNKLLVLIDGRSVYTPTFSGVYWEVQDTVLEDIERIEVIRGPGSTVWGANAMNGVINIITKSANKTKSGLVEISSGNQEKVSTSLRYGGSLGANTDARVYFKYYENDNSWINPEINKGDNNAGDEWNSFRGGFRIDSKINSSQQLTLQGDIYEIETNTLMSLLHIPENINFATLSASTFKKNIPIYSESTGWNGLARWENNINDDTQTKLQVYIADTERHGEQSIQTHKTIDIEFQHQFKPFSRHDVLWGFGYRNVHDYINNSFILSTSNGFRKQKTISAFIQDEIEISPALFLTLGSKIENYETTDSELQPNVKLAWLINGKSSLWGAVSRSIRSPALVELDSKLVTKIISAPPTFMPVIAYINGYENFKPEEMIAGEVGYRIQATEDFSADFAFFYNSYEDLRSLEPIPSSPLGASVTVDNKLAARSTGFELSLEWRIKEWLKLHSNYSYIKLHGHYDIDSLDPNLSISVLEGSTPEHQFSLQATANINKSLSLGLWAYYTDDLQMTNYDFTPTPVPAYTSINANLNWKPKENINISIAGHNLFSKHHVEFIPETIFNPVKIERSIYAKIKLHF